MSITVPPRLDSAPPPPHEGDNNKRFYNRMRDEIAREILPVVVKGCGTERFADINAAADTIAKRTYAIADAMVKVRKTYG